LNKGKKGGSILKIQQQGAHERTTPTAPCNLFIRKKAKQSWKDQKKWNNVDNERNDDKHYKITTPQQRY
jgi:hypothetical protein